MAAITIDDFQPLMAQGNLTQKKAFGMPSLFVNGNMFLSVMVGGVAYKLDADGMAKARAYPGAQAMKLSGWIEVPFEAEADWMGLAEHALRYVASLPPKQPKKK
jgi:hypothetical protein